MNGRVVVTDFVAVAVCVSVDAVRCDFDCVYGLWMECVRGVGD